MKNSVLIVTNVNALPAFELTCKLTHQTNPSCEFGIIENEDGSKQLSGQSKWNPLSFDELIGCENENFQKYDVGYLINETNVWKLKKLNIDKENKKIYFETCEVILS